ncbi:hypothetical protein ACHQM5_011696 [Ranunculus cassubicifolius]
MAGSHPLISYTVFIFSLLLVFSCLNTVHGRHETVYSHVVAVENLLPATTCSKFTPTGLKASPSVLQLHNKYSPCYTQKTPDYTEILLQDESRVRAINSKILKGGSFLTSKQAKLPANSGASLGTGNFFVTLGFGNPKKDLPVIFDTGSDLTWIQCQPCAGGCYDQRDPIFDPTKSTSYSNISCSSTACSTLSSGTGTNPRCSISACVYGIQYGDQSYSIGLFGQETLTVSPSDVFPSFQFGCGQNNDGLFGQAAGLLGLGRDKISFVSQTAAKYNKLFSYCIPSKGSGYLSFGVPSTAAKYTPLVTDSRGSSFYFLNLQGISVGGKVLSIPSSTFTVGGTIIDSGTVITRLAPTAYSALSTAFQQAMKAKGYKSAPALSILDTCYDFTSITTITFPKISLLFSGGTSMDIAATGVLYAQKVSQVCLAFAGNSDDGDITIIGNKQQQTLEVVYDVAAAKLGFRPGGCA